MVHVAPWANERLLRRPAQEDHRSPKAGHDQDRGRPRLLGEPLLGKALRQARRAGAPSRPQEASRFQAQDRRGRQEALGGGRGRAPFGHPRRAPRVLRKDQRAVGKRVHPQPDAKAPGIEPKKRSMGAGEVDEDRLVFVDEMGANVSLSALYAWSRKGEGPSVAPRGTGARTSRFWRASPRRASGPAWRWRARRRRKSSRLT